MQVLEYAEDYNDYLRGYQYGQMGNRPTSTLPEGMQYSISQCVGWGRFAALAMNEGNEQQCEFIRQLFRKEPKNGLTAGQLDLCWQVGYNSVRIQEED